MSKRTRTGVARGIHLDALEAIGAGGVAIEEREAPARVDHEAGIIRGASAMQAVEALGHGVLVDLTTLSQVMSFGNQAPGGVKVRFTHPGMCSDGMGKMLGRMRNFRVSGDRVIGDIHLNQASAQSPDGDLRAYVLGLAEEDAAAFGMSVVVSASHAWKLDNGAEVETRERPANAVGDLPYLRVDQLHAVDVVDEPAANRDGLFAVHAEDLVSAFSGTSNEAAEAAFAELDRLREALGLDADQAESFLARYFAARRNTPTAGAKPAATEDDMKIAPARLAELCKANPSHAVHLAERFAAGDDEAALVASLTHLDLAAARSEISQLQAKLAAGDEAAKAAKTASDDLAVKLAQTEARLLELGAIANAPVDPGASDVEKAKPKSISAASARSEGVNLDAVLANEVTVG